MPQIIGRSDEQALLHELLTSGSAELVAVYGRRRVGKTYLIRSFFEKELRFELTGVHQAALSQQLTNFALALAMQLNEGLPIPRPTTWFEAFQLLTTYLTSAPSKRKRVIFLDELPWLDTPRSGFLAAFDHFWNSWASKQANLIVVICGSAASWMIQHIVNNRGGLHNRITRRIRLLPFTLAETETFLRTRRVILDRYQMLQLYMAMGGIPHYLKEIRPGESAMQAIDRLCFTKDGLLQTEFANLYVSLFQRADRHISVIRALSGKPQGLTRTELIEVCQLTSGGTITGLFDELLESGFVAGYVPFGKTVKETIYKLTDEYSLFYLKFIEGSRATGEGTWLRKSTGQSWKSWSGLAFEQICQKHLPVIKKALGIAGVYSEMSVWRYVSSKTSEKGTQIDLIIDRQDHCINLCEIKFSSQEFVIDKAYSDVLTHKRDLFKERTGTRKSLFITLITTFGVRQNVYSTSLVQQQITMNALFE